MALPIYVPIGYITILFASLAIFSKVYRKRTAQALAREHGQPWFPEGHPERDIYQTLVQASSEQSDSIPDVVLKAALLNRAMADVRRIMRLRDDKQALSVLLQKGSIGDESMAKFTLAEKELEAEIIDVVSEANTFREGWGQLIFPSASEMVTHLKHKEAYYGIPEQRSQETKKLSDAGLSIPQPKVELPPLVTPAGTSITIGAAGPASQQSAASDSKNIPLSNGASPKTTKSTSVEEVTDDQLHRLGYTPDILGEWWTDGEEGSKSNLTFAPPSSTPSTQAKRKAHHKKKRKT